MGYRLMHRPWRAKKPLYWGMLPELAGIVPLLVLFGVAQPDAYRSLFWRIGHDYKLNSSPTMLLYAYANFRPLPTVPFVWTKTLTYYNVVIAIVALFVLLAKMIATIMKIFYPIFGTIISFAMTAMFVVSVYGQAGPDYADDRYPSPTPWYLRKSCEIARPYNAVKSCHMARGSFAVTVYMLTVYLFQFGFALWAMWPNKMLDIPPEDSDDEDNYGRPSNNGKEAASVDAYEMTPPGGSVQSGMGGMPFTPRTQAFHTLDRKLPFREQYR
ncbi:hypothetical protein QBC38DRAFT_262833 [Podospora fimiseda]|uniref:Uncharacterized protein n=1 Tax=Podospora fimiseda TaxID=252190 RepID=A0AAN7BYG2_9PEZI|nr:hypothetical protein QBC38DRAFT_262833 [Podospora fimiseda]